MAEMTVDLMSVERRLWSGEASFVLARTTVGQVGIMPGHQPLLGQMEEAGVVRIDGTDGNSITVAVHGGFLSVSAERVSILAEYAEMSDEIDTDRARKALDRADGSDEEGAAARARAEVRLKAAEASSR
ncbi:F0F1 ATP synthase subunit epsilon [Pseudonocardia sp. KRD291]|uniref:F0F1 ATP synthase subunit epsilon n=1 Tax=Pseudonocardia sp. KRD291 TaxID=2792007 RepID=UPI001C49E271|nr:F0F1 ATP synthase subunit epsilon [Pseudonocardia sp. KRD291]MBW0103683.1 F0F1 ATP synthase subunit epsilon [Pseudonocardia sp. KRD291]